jgi:hypothetical protein
MSRLNIPNFVAQLKKKLNIMMGHNIGLVLMPQDPQEFYMKLYHKKENLPYISIRMPTGAYDIDMETSTGISWDLGRQKTPIIKGVLQNDHNSVAEQLLIILRREKWGQQN